MTYNEDIPPNCDESFLNLISAQPELKELELKYFSTSRFMPLLRQKMLQTKSQSLQKLILQGIKFNKNNLAIHMPNLNYLFIKQSFGNPFGEDKNNLPNLQRLELIDNDVELNRTILKSKCTSLKFLKIIEKELSNEVKEEIFHKLCQLQLGGFSYYDLPYSSQDYLQALGSYLPSLLTILNLLNIYDYSHRDLNYFLQDFDIERVKLEFFILPFNVELNLLPNLRYFIKKAKYLRYIEIVQSENYNIEKQKKSEMEIIDLCQARNIKCILKSQLCVDKVISNTSKSHKKLRM
ncbi:172_t:CDS:2 [Racocetra fulgida]|uniref:172_t:CDS:1 n=1 Tax=Racocetra fulgida TaxID=60492 RepID=A0A9N9FBR7_9GLOM|nr:172_t:CDS:2 [Racocetra fulgida]